MATFEYQRGYVSISEKKLDINGGPRTTVKRWYNERKSTVVLISLGVIIVALFGIFDIGPTRLLISVFLVIVAGMIVDASLKRFDIVEHKSTIPTQSIEKVTFSQMGRLSASEATVHYTDSDGDEHARKILLANPLMSSNDRLEPAIEAFQRENVDIDRNNA